MHCMVKDILSILGDSTQFYSAQGAPEKTSVLVQLCHTSEEGMGITAWGPPPL